jgi:hypothetical protein
VVLSWPLSGYSPVILHPSLTLHILLNRGGARCLKTTFLRLPCQLGLERNQRQQKALALKCMGFEVRSTGDCYSSGRGAATQAEQHLSAEPTYPRQHLFATSRTDKQQGQR